LSFRRYECYRLELQHAIGDARNLSMITAAVSVFFIVDWLISCPSPSQCRNACFLGQREDNDQDTKDNCNDESQP
jgi:hypothetical protein